MDYIRNSKNRKLKTQVLEFFSRIFFGIHRLGISGKGIMLASFSLLLSLFFPWITFEKSAGVLDRYWAFSLYTGYIGYGIIMAFGVILFFLLSHTKKEAIRAYVPFRLSDTQAIVFCDAMILVSMIHLLFTFLTFKELSSATISAGLGLEIAFSSACILLGFSYAFSQSEKEAVRDIGHLDKTENFLEGYEDIIDTKKEREALKKRNMSLPI